MEAKSNTFRPRVGIWCAYHITLEPSEGIGVFAHNIARGLAEDGQCSEIVMLCKPGDEDLLRPTVKKGLGRIKAVELPSKDRLQRLKAKIWWRLNRTSQKLANWTHQRGAYWARDRFNRLCSLSMARTIANQQNEEQRAENIINCCDVWLVPYVGLERSFSKPTVVTIHDLVCVHFPDMLSPEQLAEFKRLSTKVANQSTVASCMSKFIAQNDLRGVLGLPDEKIRVVEASAPRDFGELANRADFVKKHPVLDKPFLFYPSAFRAYKNHEQLVEALSILRCQTADDLHLVFTGIHEPPASLNALIRQRGLEGRAHILGKIEREALSLFYANAQATIVPSHYEQGSYPLMEAMYWGCPIAASGIESLRELFAKMGEDMVFFDQNDSRDLADKLQSLLQNRDQVVQAQQQHRDTIFGRTWKDAAKDWVEVFRYAIEKHERDQDDASQQKAA